MIYISDVSHIQFTKTVLTRIKKELGHAPCCVGCGKEFQIEDEALSIIDKNNPHKRKYSCSACFLKEASK